MILLALLPLSAACTPIDDRNDDGNDASPPVPEQTPPRRSRYSLEGKCDAKAAQAYIGKTANAEVMAQAKAAAGASNVRTLRPGQMVTMEFNAGRLNLDVDENNVITNARCG